MFRQSIIRPEPMPRQAKGADIAGMEGICLPQPHKARATSGIICLASALILCLSLAASLASCSEADNLLTTLNDAIKQMQVAPESFQQIMKQTVDKIADKTTETARQVIALANDVVFNTAALGLCMVDQVLPRMGLHVLQHLEFIRDKYLLKMTADRPSPIVCNFNPNTGIVLTWDPEQYGAKWHAIPPGATVFGYDFSADNPPEVDLLDDNNVLIRKLNLIPVFESKYQIQLTLVDDYFAHIDEHDSRMRGARIGLFWANPADSSDRAANQLPLLTSTQPQTIACPNAATLLNDERTGTLDGRNIKDKNSRRVTCTEDQGTHASITYRIINPTVRLATVAFPDIQFADGEQVTISADGCLNNGNHWTRYMDGAPGGTYGLIYIPGTGIGQPPSTLVRPSDVLHPTGNPSYRVPWIGGPFAVTKPQSPTNLVLGFRDDDNYLDNGYEDNYFTDMTDECKQIDLGVNLTITISVA